VASTIYYFRKKSLTLKTRIKTLLVDLTTSDGNNQKTKNKTVFAILRMPDGKEHEIPLPAKTFKSGREGYYAQVPSFIYENEVYGGQIQLWKKGNENKKV
jgi:hypothetical protein